MAGFLVDEDLPRSLSLELRKSGFEAVDVRDIGLRSRPDDEIRAHALKAGLAMLTGDLEYGNLLRFPSHPAGTVIVRLPHELSAGRRIEMIVASLRGMTIDEFANSVSIVGLDGLRQRRLGPPA